MIKFLHKKHINKDHGNAKIIIYYNLSDIFLGTTLIILVAFFIHDYLLHSLFDSQRASLYINPNTMYSVKTPIPIKKPY